MLATDAGDESFVPEVVTQGGEGPAAVRQAELWGIAFGQVPDRLALAGGQACGSAAGVWPSDAVQAVLLESMEVGVGGMGVNLQKVGDLGS
jgi:hypothetical protein